MSQAHRATHLGHDKLQESIRRYFLVLASPLCVERNPKIATPALRLTPLQGAHQNPQSIQLKGTLPLEHLEVDFTEMEPYRHFRFTVGLGMYILGMEWRGLPT